MAAELLARRLAVLAGLQLDECAFPMLLLDMAWRDGALRRPVLQAFWPMLERAAGFVLRNGPRTRQDRWEENAGYTPFTLAVDIAALLAAAEIADVCEVADLADLLRDTADGWNEQIEDWVYVQAPASRRKPVLPATMFAWRRNATTSSAPIRMRRCRFATTRSARGPAGRRTGQHRCARAGALRPARGGRSPYR